MNCAFKNNIVRWQTNQQDQYYCKIARSTAFPTQPSPRTNTSFCRNAIIVSLLPNAVNISCSQRASSAHRLLYVLRVLFSRYTYSCKQAETRATRLKMGVQ